MSTNDRFTVGTNNGNGAREAELQEIHEALRGLRYGAVTIIVQDGVVIQIDRTEKRRLRRPTTEANNLRKDVS